MNMAVEDPKAETDRFGNIVLSDFLAQAAFFKSLNNRILNLLRIHFPEAEAEPKGVCHPPSVANPQGWFDAEGKVAPQDAAAAISVV
jgi:hypothetical protein